MGLYVQVIAAAGYAWLLLDERLTPLQMTGGVVVLAAIALARRTRRVALPASAGAPRAQELLFHGIVKYCDLFLDRFANDT